MSHRLRPHPRRRAVAALFLGLAASLAAALPARADFASCMTGVRADALARGITAETFDTYAAPLQPNDVLQFVNAQPEFTTPVWDYLAGLVDDERIADGMAQMREYPNALASAASLYGVDSYTIVAVWGVESDYGKGFGKRNILPSLATLACSGISRARFFENEFIAALRIVQEGHIRADRLYGSWAGAFGHTQFMPTTFLRFAVDLDGDGRRDVVDSVPDALASTANYLRQHGWVPGGVWGFEVRVPADYKGPSGRGHPHPMSTWAARGITRADGKHLGEGSAALLQPAGPGGPAFLVTRNFEAIYAYNNSENYALAIALLSDRLRGKPGIAAAWPGGMRGLTREDRREIQKLLARRGYDIGDADGVLGAKSRVAIADFQEKSGLPRDGLASSKVLDALRAGGGGGGLFGN